MAKIERIFPQDYPPEIIDETAEQKAIDDWNSLLSFDAWEQKTGFWSEKNVDDSQLPTTLGSTVLSNSVEF
jgi:hypothetical protein